jgi:hypothetical protein
MTPREIAVKSLKDLEDAVVQYLDQRKEGSTNAQVTHDLSLESDFEGQQKSYLAYSILGRLISANRVRYEKQGRSKLYFSKA